MALHRINCEGSVTDTLVRAMESAERMKHVIVLYETKDGDDSPGGVMTQPNVTLAQMNYLLDLAKHWIFD